MDINIPSEFIKMNSMPGDPADSTAYGKETQAANCYLMIFPIDNRATMPYEDTQTVINGIHNALTDMQGLIEVKAGKTKSKKKYIYSIVKTKLEPSGMQYVLTMHIDMKDRAANLQAFFDETGTTGQRDTLIMSQMFADNKINSSKMDKWFVDPYDKTFRKGLLMNLSEQPKYDELFPQHPLSEARRFVKYIIENN